MPPMAVDPKETVYHRRVRWAAMAWGENRIPPKPMYFRGIVKSATGRDGRSMPWDAAVQGESRIPLKPIYFRGIAKTDTVRFYKQNTSGARVRLTEHKKSIQIILRQEYCRHPCAERPMTTKSRKSLANIL